jgi:hypothetical protein
MTDGMKQRYELMHAVGTKGDVGVVEGADRPILC